MPQNDVSLRLGDCGFEQPISSVLARMETNPCSASTRARIVSVCFQPSCLPDRTQRSGLQFLPTTGRGDRTSEAAASAGEQGRCGGARTVQGADRSTDRGWRLSCAHWRQVLRPPSSQGIRWKQANALLGLGTWLGREQSAGILDPSTAK